MTTLYMIHNIKKALCNHIFAENSLFALTANHTYHHNTHTVNRINIYIRNCSINSLNVLYYHVLIDSSRAPIIIKLIKRLLELIYFMPFCFKHKTHITYFFIYFSS